MHITSMEGAYSLDGKTAIVTGGTRGIGFGIATAFAHQGANVAILCRDEAKAAAAIAELSEKYAGTFKFYKTDISDMQNCRDSVAKIIEDFKQIDILVNNAGIGVVGNVLDMDEDLSKWFRCFDIDLHGAMRMSYLVGKHMREHKKGGRIINITSNAGAIVNIPDLMPAYSCSKAALNQLTKCLAYEFAKFGVRVNAIAPGFTFSDLSSKMPKEVYDETCQKIPAGRFGEAVEIGALASYLASDSSDILTGAVITIDGGYSLAR